MFATKGFMLALHVPASFAKDKNRLTRALYRVVRQSNIDVKEQWTSLDHEMSSITAIVTATSTTSHTSTRY